MEPMKCSKHPRENMRRESRPGALGSLSPIVRYYCPACRRNRQRRAQNEALRTICGTSAAAARRDMGL